jgi:hypothetical protein
VVSNRGSVKFRKTQRGTDRHRQIGRQFGERLIFGVKAEEVEEEEKWME